MQILAQLMAEITRQSRYQVVAGVDFEWSNLLSHNLFRCFEVIFWRKFGIRAEVSAGVLSDGSVYQIAHSWEAAIVIFEQHVRNFFSFKWARLPIRVWIPIMQTPQGFAIPTSPYLFAIAFDTSANGATSASGAISWSHTVTGSNTFGVVYLFQNNPADDITVTFNSVSMTKAATSQQSADTNKMSLFYLASPTTGTISGAGNAATTYFTGGSESFSGAPGGLDSVATNNPAAGTTLTLTTTVVAANCWLVSGCRLSGQTVNAGTGTTKRQSGGGADYGIGDSNATVGTGSQSMGWTHTSDNQGGIIISISPTAAGATPKKVKPTLLLMGVG
jgi:hypothetical protein